MSGVKVLSGTFNGTGPDDCEGILMFVVKLSPNGETMRDILLHVIYQALEPHRGFQERICAICLLLCK